MWFTDGVNVPDAVVQARSAHELVVFVGAGASIGTPSNLPTFEQLALRVANDLSVSDEGADRPDVFLDRLERAGRPVRSSVVHQLSDPKSLPNDLHTAIVRLFDGVDTMRIVTTNYDEHLSTAAGQNFGALPPIYAGPALPLGRNFNGIVHLHGTLTGPVDDLVITTSDFGRAYLTDAWAARFLNDLFHRYVTLFVGYSHNDVVMRYLAQGLRPESRRFGFMPDTGDPEEWRPLEIYPVLYPATSGHLELVEVVATWGDRIRMGQLDHQQRIQEMVVTGLPQTRADTAYLEVVIADDATARLFAEHVSDTKWLIWIMERAPFPSLFAQDEVLSDAGVALAVWFAEIARSDPQTALDVAQRYGGKLHGVTAQRVAWAFRQNRPEAKDLGRWVALLINNATPVLDQELSTLLAHSRWPEDADVALTLFDHLATHRVEIQPAFPNLAAGSSTTTDDAESGIPRFSVESLKGDDHWLHEAWTSFFKPHLDELATPLTEILMARLASAHRTLRGVGQANQQWDEQSFHRSAIAPDGQDSIPWSSYLLVDALRDCVEFLTNARPNEAASLINRLESSDVPLLRRIAIHGWTVRTDISADEKLAHLVASGNLYAFATKRETYRLIEATAAAADTARGDLLEAARQGPPASHSSSDERIDVHETLTLLSWIAQSLPDFPDARATFEEFQAQHPHLRPAEHPGYDSWSGPSGFTASYPFPLEEIFKCRTAAELDLLIDKVAATDPQILTMWAFRIPAAFADAASQDLEWAQGVLTDLSERGDWTSPFWTAILPGVSRAAPQADEDRLTSMTGLLAGVVEHVASATEGGQIIPSIAEFLMAVVRRPELTGEALDAAEAVGAGVVGKVHLGAGDFITEEPVGIFDRALNDWTGWITQFWINTISHRRRIAGDSWAGLSDDAKHSLEQLLDALSPYDIYPQAILAANFTFLNDVDETWASERVRVLFAWANDHDGAARAWSAFLAGAPWNERIGTSLNSDLRTAFGELHNDLGKVLAGRFAQLVVHTSSNIHSDGTLATFIATADEEMRTHFAAQVSWLLLHQSTPEYAESQWPRWIEHYLAERLESRPLPLVPPEAGQMLGWVVTARSHFPDAVASYVRANARFSEFYGLFNEIKKRNLARQYPDQLALLLRYILERSDPAQFFVCSDLAEILHQLIPAVEALQRDTLLAVCEAAAKLHCPEASTWKIDVEGQWADDE
jgi:SIR2-like domain/Domain of unknown function (DUF4020)